MKIIFSLTSLKKIKKFLPLRLTTCDPCKPNNVASQTETKQIADRDVLRVSHKPPGCFLGLTTFMRVISEILRVNINRYIYLI